MLLASLVAELLLLYVLSRWLTKSLYGFFLMVFRARSVAVSAVTILLFPGTVIHELSHLFTAEILGVKTGKLELAPESIKEQDVRVGSVAIAQTDPFRRAFIGLAPLGTGILSLTALSWWLPNIWNSVLSAERSGVLFSSYPLYLFIGILYLLFSVSNSMFSSPQDLKGCLPLTIVIALLFGGVYALGFRFFLTGQILETSTRILRTLSQSTGIVLVINGLLLITIRILIVLAGKITKTRLLARNK